MSNPTSKHKTLPILLILLFTLLVPMSALAQTGTVHVILLYSPFCGHCQQLISETLPPIIESYTNSYEWRYYGDPPNEETGQMPQIVAFEGDVLHILYVDSSTELGIELYTKAAEYLQIPPEDQVVPIMIVGEEVLVGGLEIPEELPGLIDRWSAEGGLPWPAIPGLDEIVAGLVPFPNQPQEAQAEDPTTSSSEDPAEPTVTEDPAGSLEEAQDPMSDQAPAFEFDRSKLTVLERIQLDPLGNSLSIMVLIGMVFSMVGIGYRWRLTKPQQKTQPLPTIIALLIFIGILVAGYLSFVETTGTEAVCGPVGDCNTVQDSPYATLFGFLPVGILGLIGYAAMLAAWIIGRRNDTVVARYAILVLFGSAIAGTVFSIYLTFLEPFVIGATCMWCLSSAVIVTAISLISTGHAQTAYSQLRAHT